MSKERDLKMYRTGFVDALSFYDKTEHADIGMKAIRHVLLLERVPNEKTAKTIRPRKARKARNSTVQTVRQTVPSGSDAA